MKLVIGGASQGKRAFAGQRFQIEQGWVDGRDAGWEEILACKGVDHFHDFIRRVLTGETQAPCLAEKMQDASRMEAEAGKLVKVLFEGNPHIVVIQNELGCGIVPMEKEERIWREAAGRIGICLAAKSEEVYRVVCGIGMKIK